MSALDKKLTNALKRLNRNDDLTYLIKALNERKINNYTEAAVLIFLLLYCHPYLMDDKPLRKLCQDCFSHTNAEQLFALLKEPENLTIKHLFDQFVQMTTFEKELAHVQKKLPPLSRPGNR